MSSPTQKRVVLPRSERAVPRNATHIGRTDPQANHQRFADRETKESAGPERAGRTRLFRARSSMSSMRRIRPASTRCGVCAPAWAGGGRGVVEFVAADAGVARAGAGDGEGVRRGAARLRRRPRRRKRFHTFTGQAVAAGDTCGAGGGGAGTGCAAGGEGALSISEGSEEKEETAAAAQPEPFNPPQVAALYNFPTSVNGTGQTIGILELGGGYNDERSGDVFSGAGADAADGGGGFGGWRNECAGRSEWRGQRSGAGY